MSRFDFCFAWCWPYDADFAAMLDLACRENDISLVKITPENVLAAIQALQEQNLEISAFFDRASDADEKFLPLTNWAIQQNLLYINRYWLARRAWDKATMHQQFTRSGLDAPYTIVLPNYRDHPEIPVLDLTPLGDPFAIKPAHGGGGQGVIMGANNWEQVQEARQSHPDDQYLLQTQVTPVTLGGKVAWFRLIYCLGNSYCCWWDPHTHIYTPMSAGDFERYSLTTLMDIPQRIARMSQLELFSTEVALDINGRLLVIDYINDPIDLRLQSRVPQGVPDQIVQMIANSLSEYIVMSKTKAKNES